MGIVRLVIVVCNACIRVRHVRRIKDLTIVLLAPRLTILQLHYPLAHVLSTLYPIVSPTIPLIQLSVKPVPQATNTTPPPTPATSTAHQIVSNAHPLPTAHNASLAFTSPAAPPTLHAPNVKSADAQHAQETAQPALNVPPVSI